MGRIKTKKSYYHSYVAGHFLYINLMVNRFFINQDEIVKFDWGWVSPTIKIWIY